MTARSSLPARPDGDANQTTTPIVAAANTEAPEGGPSFAELGLPKPLTAALARTGITTPFAIQIETIPDALAGRDVLARARTGSGKTLAFGLPMLARLADAGPARSRRPLALVLVPTRELAMQVHDALEPLAHSLQLKLKLVAGGLSMSHQISALQGGVHLVVATPGRLADLVRRGNCELGHIQATVLDEADHMADMGFLPEVTAILEGTAPRGQRLLFSATLDSDVDALVRRFMHDPVRHSVVASKESVATMEHLVLQVPPNAKYQTAARIAAREGRTLVFVRTKLAADRVAAQLREVGVLACALHGGKSQHERNSVLAGFKDGTVPVLVATDVAARGIHVDDVNLVLQVDPAGDSKDYLHRAGRTARAGGSGTVLTLALPHQRREVERLTTGAGVSAAWHQMHRDDEPGRRMVDELTGGREPSGIGVSEPRFRTERRGAPNRGPRRPAGSGGYRGTRDGEHGRPAARGPQRRGSSDRARQGERQH